MNEREIVNALNELWRIYQYLPAQIEPQAHYFFTKFENGEDFELFDLTNIEWLVETGLRMESKHV